MNVYVLRETPHEFILLRVPLSGAGCGFPERYAKTSFGLARAFLLHCISEKAHCVKTLTTAPLDKVHPARKDAREALQYAHLRYRVDFNAPKRD